MDRPISEIVQENSTKKIDNSLFPVFVKLEQLRVLLVGAGNVGLEKLHAIYQNAPATAVTVVASDILPDFSHFAEGKETINILNKSFHPDDLDGQDIVFCAVNDIALSEEIRNAAHSKGLLVNCADKPALCDFYLSSVVTKGNLKIAISTNGKSPTVAKRLREVLQDGLPATIDDLLENMSKIRENMEGDFTEKVNRLNAITQPLTEKNEPKKENKIQGRKWRKIAYECLIAFGLMILGHALFSIVPLDYVWAQGKELFSSLDRTFYFMILAGFIAQLVDGMLGMGYGVTCTAVLLGIGIPLPAISGGIHTAEMFSSGASGFSHYKFGNVNKRLLKYLIIPGVIGSVAGAYLLSRFGDKYESTIKPFVALYTLILGIRILRNAFKKNRKVKKVKKVGWLALAGGFLDSFGGGGWGPLVTSTLISKGKTPRFVIGTVSLSEFFVTLASALTFFGMLDLKSLWQVILGLIIGGVAAAPIAARLAGKLPLKTMFIGIGTMIVIWSAMVFVKMFFK